MGKSQSHMLYESDGLSEGHPRTLEHMSTLMRLMSPRKKGASDSQKIPTSLDTDTIQNRPSSNNSVSPRGRRGRSNTTFEAFHEVPEIQLSDLTLVENVGWGATGLPSPLLLLSSARRGRVSRAGGGRVLT